MDRWYHRIEAFVRSKSFQVPIAIISLVGLPFLIRGWIYSVRQSNAWHVQQRMNAALQEAERVPLGFERAETYLARLKAIDAGYAPDDLKQALADYTSALEQSIDAAKAIRPEYGQSEEKDGCYRKRYDQYGRPKGRSYLIGAQRRTTSESPR